LSLPRLLLILGLDDHVDPRPRIDMVVTLLPLARPALTIWRWVS